MHEVLELILRTKDLAKAGDLFSIADDEIEKDCSRWNSVECPEIIWKMVVMWHKRNIKIQLVYILVLYSL